ncbi:MAG: helix-turn-helix domain-containing protein [Bacteroidota bacterium]
METKNLIKNQSRMLFNQHGVRNITLRDVSKKLNKSYGNLTYHYPTKQDVILELHRDMNLELTKLQRPSDNLNLLAYFLALPAMSYSITLKYLFFSIDFTEIKRNFSDVYSEIYMSTETRRSKWLSLLKKLKKQGYFNQNIKDDELNYIMFLSGSARTAYFQTLPASAYNEKAYCKMVNMLLKAYLSEAGIKIYDDVLSSC